MPAPIWRIRPARTISLCEIASASAGGCFSVGRRYSDRRVIGQSGRSRPERASRVYDLETHRPTSPGSEEPRQLRRRSSAVGAHSRLELRAPRGVWWEPCSPTASLPLIEQRGPLISDGHFDKEP